MQAIPRAINGDAEADDGLIGRAAERPAADVGGANRAVELRGGRRRGFSLIELMVVLVMLSLLLLAVAPAFTRTSAAAPAMKCLINLKRLTTAWQMYAQDNQDQMVVALHGGAAQGGSGDSIYGVAWAEGWLDWTTSTDNTNTALLVNPKYSRLANYLREGPEVFKCPADRYLSPPQIARGWARRVRSYSGNVGLGVGNAEAGPWNTLYKHTKRTSEYQYPSPAETWVYADEHPDSINDPAFFSPNRQSWIDLPATYHNGGAGFAFADGHAEIHKWSGSLIRVKTVIFNWNPPIPAISDPDVHWMSFHTQRRSANSY